MLQTELEAERDKAIRSKEFCEQWYAERFQAIHAYGKAAGEPLFSDLCSLMANGTLTGARLCRGEQPFVYDPPTYAQLLNTTTHERDRAVGELTQCRALLDSYGFHQTGIHTGIIAMQNQILSLETRERERIEDAHGDAFDRDRN